MARITVAAVKKELDSMGKFVDEHDKILVRGNGQPSLQERLRNIEAFIMEEKENRKYYTRLIIGIFVTNIVGLFAATTIWIIKVVPVINQLSNIRSSLP